MHENASKAFQRLMFIEPKQNLVCKQCKDVYCLDNLENNRHDIKSNCDKCILIKNRLIETNKNKNTKKASKIDFNIYKYVYADKEFFNPRLLEEGINMS